MPESHFLPERVNIYIQRPTCPRCRAHMMLARIMPHSVGFDLRMFECPKCEHVQEVIVETGAFGRP
jgi:transposase-like protein